MKNWCVFLTACLLCGCLGDSKPRQSNDLQMAAQAEWAFACAKLGVNTNNTPPPALDDESRENVGNPHLEGVSTSPERPVICAYAPAWSSDSQEFLEWYEASADILESLPFVIEIVPDEQIPEGLKQYPAFTYGDKGTLGWTDIETLQAELLGDSDGTP